MSNSTNGFFEILKAVLFALLFCVAYVVIFAVVLRFVNLSDTVIKCVNQCFKALAILLGCLLAVRGEKGWLKGLVVGIFFIMLTELIFSLLAGGLGNLLALDLCFGAVVGLICGIIAVNRRS